MGRLLKAHHDSERFLDSPALQYAEPLVRGEDLFPSPVPSDGRIGNFRVTEVLGRGGMGEVFLGERDDGQFVQRVALKVIQHHAPGLVRRFLEERRILAGLEHPGIARLIDGGVTAQGRPYLAMELVKGKSLDQYCDAQGLGLDQRLDLFRSVCEAVTYAHQHLVVHRDLKPSNIMVTDDGRVKLLDFGIAKVLTPSDAPGLTRTGESVMTPEYAAPEQTRGAAVTTVTDVYALGVVLYLLVTNRRPYELRGKSPAEIERVVCEVEPLRPSVAAAGTALQWRRRLPGDLEAIVMMALRKEPGRRYPSAMALQADLDRFQSGLPVRARPNSSAYRALKFVRRNGIAVGAAVVAAATMLGATVFSVGQMRQARHQRDVAVQESQRQEATIAIQKVLAGDARGSDGRPLSPTERIELAERLLRQRHQGDPWIVAELTHELGTQLFDNGDRAAQRQMLSRGRQVALAAGLGPQLALLDCALVESYSYDDQLDSARAALAEAKAALARAPDPLSGPTVVCLEAEGSYLQASNHPDSAIGLLRRAVSASQEGDHRLFRPTALMTLATALRAAGRTREATGLQRLVLVAHDSIGYLGTDQIPAIVSFLASALSELGEIATVDSVVTAEMDKLEAISGQRSSGLLNFLHGLAQLRRGQLDSAASWIGLAARDTTDGAGGLSTYLPPATTQLRLEQGRIAEARRSLRVLPMGTPTRRVGRAWLTARIQHDEGDVKGGAQLLEDSLRVFAGGKAVPPPFSAMPFVTAAEWRLTAGDPKGADSLAGLARAAAAVDSLALDRSAYVGRAELVRARARLALGDRDGAGTSASRAATALGFGYGPANPFAQAARALRDSLRR